MKILRLQKLLFAGDAMPEHPALRLRPYTGPADMTAWLRLRAAAFAGITAAGREWTAGDFEREFLSRSWWRPDAMRLAETVDRPQIVGAVSVGRTGRPPDDQACIQWLMVMPEFRRQGIGMALVAAAEQMAFAQGERRVVLETHGDWREAVRLYERLGYVRSL